MVCKYIQCDCAASEQAGKGLNKQAGTDRVSILNEQTSLTCLDHGFHKQDIASKQAGSWAM